MPTSYSLRKAILSQLNYFVLYIVVWFIFYATPIVTGLLIRQFFNTIDGDAVSISAPLQILLLLFIIQTSRLLSTYARVFLDNVLEQRISSSLRAHFLSHVLARPTAWSSRTSIGTTLNSLRDDIIEIVTSVNWLATVIGQMLASCIALVILFAINPVITCVVFVPTVIVYFTVKSLTTSISSARRATQVSAENVTSFLSDIVSSIVLVKSSMSDEAVLKKFSTLIESRNKSMVHDKRLNILLNSSILGATQLGTALILLVAAYSIQHKSFSIGDFALFVQYLDWIMGVPFMIGNTITKLKQLNIATQRLNSLVCESPDWNFGIHNVETMYAEADSYDQYSLQNLRIANLSYSYNSSLSGIKNISFEVQRGQFIAIVGRVGAGKTTLLKAILGLLPVEKGKIYWNQWCISNPANFFVPPQVAYTPQVPKLLNDTIRNNILLGSTLTLEKLNAVLYEAALDKDLSQLEYGIYTTVGARAGFISGGQQQRIAVARMLTKEAELLICDDLSSALDIETENALWERLLHNKRHTVIAVSHRQEILRKADKIIVLKGGHVESIGTLEYLIRNSEEFSNILST